MLRHTAFCALLCAWLVGAGDAAATHWTIAGEALRARHADTLEDLLRDLPLLAVDRAGARGLPYAARAGHGQPELLVVLDGVPQRDPWTGRPLAEEIPLSLVESVEIDLAPATLAHGAEGRAGVVRVTTRRHAEPLVRTRIQLTRNSYGERGRQLSFETPPGRLAFALGLDEFFGEGYAFGLVWTGPGGADPVTPEVDYSRRRALSTRLLMDGGAAGPLELGLTQTRWHLDLAPDQPRSRYRQRYRVHAAAPGTPAGAFRLEHGVLRSWGLGWDARDSALRLDWNLDLAAPGLDSLGLRAGAERHQLSLVRAGAPEALPRPAFTWLALAGRRPLADGLVLSGGARWELEHERAPAILWDGRLDWGGPRGLALEGFVTGGDARAPWERDRLPGWSLWPEGFSDPDAAAVAAPVFRGGLGLRARGERGHALLQLLVEDGGADWRLERGPGGGLTWRAESAALAPVLALGLGGTLAGPLGRAKTELGLSVALDPPEHEPEDLPPLETGFPHRGKLGAQLSRPFFRSDARLGIGGRLELLAGHPRRDPLWRADVEVELRVLDSRFWLRLRNALDWSGEELSGFPVPPISLQLGMDWHLDH